MITTMKSEVNILWVVLWMGISAGWSVFSFHWLKKTVEALRPSQGSPKSQLGGLIVRRVSLILVMALLFFLALKTEPVAAIAMAITLTVATWVQVVIYNVKLNKQTADPKEKYIGSN